MIKFVYKYSAKNNKIVHSQPVPAQNDSDT